MRRFNSSHLAIALAVFLSVTAYSLSLLLRHPAEAQAAAEDEPLMYILQGVWADEFEPPDVCEQSQEWRCACSREDAQAVQDYFPPPANLTRIALCHTSTPHLKMASLKYPQLAQEAARISGEVVVCIVFDEAGRVIHAEALSGHPLLTPAAVKAACQTRFKPHMLSAPSFQTSGTLTFNFVLE